MGLRAVEGWSAGSGLLGTKLFSRIKDENHRRVIRDFLAQE